MLEAGVGVGVTAFPPQCGMLLHMASLHEPIYSPAHTCHCVVANNYCRHRCVLTDEFLRVEGSDGSIFVFGDAATIHTPLASEHVDELFDTADADKDGLLSVSELQKVLHGCEAEFPHLARHARFLDGKQNRYVGPTNADVGGFAVAGQAQAVWWPFLCVADGFSTRAQQDVGSR